MDRGDAKLSGLLATDLDRHFGELVQRYQHVLYAFALRQSGSALDAEDIVQEAFVQAYYALAGYPAERISVLMLRPWLYKITLNIFYDHVRQAKLCVVSLDLSEEGGHLSIEDDASLQPEALLEERETLNALASHVVQLPMQYREAVNLYYFGGLSYREIADLLNQPMGTIKSNLYRGIRLLRRVLASEKSEAK